MRYGWPDLRRALEDKGFEVFHAGEYDLNLVGVRSADRVPHHFDDTIHCALRVGNGWAHYEWPATTDPGVAHLRNPINPAGTAILQAGQHRSAFKLGTHKGYAALVQAAPLPVYRDRDRDDVAETEGDVDWGWFGINLHRARASGTSSVVDRWSAGCQVLADSRDLELLLHLVREQERRGLGATVTYTLLDEADL